MKRFAVIGCGSFGFYLAKALYENKNQVIAIDRSKEKIQAIDPSVTTAIVQDATDAESLKGLGLEEMDAVIVSTGANIKSSILICFYLKKIGFKKLLPRRKTLITARFSDSSGRVKLFSREWTWPAGWPCA